MGTSIVREDGTTLTFDAVPRLGFSPSVNVTDHPIEDGSVISDHAQAQPLLISITGLVSESPFTSTSSTGGAARVLAAIDFLKACEGQLVSVVSDRLGTFENCLVTRYPYDLTVKRSLVFEVELKQVRIATAGSVTLPVGTASEEVEDSAASEVDVGQQATTTTASDTNGEGAAKEEADKSTLLELAEALGAV
jgi:hypothetical protein